MFHRFHKSGTRPLGQGSVSDTEFEQIINMVGIDRIISPDEWLEKIRHGKLEPEDICVTLDDGLASQYNVALPVLEQFGIKAFWFIFSSVFKGGIDKNEIYNRFATTHFSSFDDFTRDFIEFGAIKNNIFHTPAYREYFSMMGQKAPFFTSGDFKFRYVRNFILQRREYEKMMDEFILSKDTEVSQLARDIWMTNENLEHLNSTGHCIGLHSYDHPSVLKELPLKDQEAQYRSNKNHIWAVTGNPVESVAHPLNSYSAETLNILNRLGVFCGFRSDMIPHVVSTRLDGIGLEIPREDSTHLLNAL